MKIIHAPHTASEVEAQRPVYLQIERGSTRFPLRPVDGARFIIGTGTCCHLQLGGDLPMVHSVLIRAGEQWEVEAFAPEPPLLVNGLRQRRCRVSDDDLMEIAMFQFRLVQGDTVQAAPVAQQPAALAG
jgi:hypothetical protein